MRRTGAYHRQSKDRTSLGADPIPEARHRVWFALRLADRPLEASEVAFQCQLSKIEAERRLSAFVKEGFVHWSADVGYSPIWNGRMPR